MFLYEASSLVKAYVNDNLKFHVKAISCHARHSVVTRDFTRFRRNTFFDSFKDGICHTAMAYSFDEVLCRKIFDVGQELGLQTHPKGCVVTIEGPRFSTVA